MPDEEPGSRLLLKYTLHKFLYLPLFGKTPDKLEFQDQSSQLATLPFWKAKRLLDTDAWSAQALRVIVRSPTSHSSSGRLNCQACLWRLSGPCSEHVCLAIILVPGAQPSFHHYVWFFMWKLKV